MECMCKDDSPAEGRLDREHGAGAVTWHEGRKRCSSMSLVWDGYTLKGDCAAEFSRPVTMTFMVVQGGSSLEDLDTLSSSGTEATRFLTDGGPSSLG